MAFNTYGPMVTFESAGSTTGQVQPYKWFTTTPKYDTCSKVAGYFGSTAFAPVIVNLNSSIKLGKQHYLNNPRTKLRPGTRLRLPSWMADPKNPDLAFSVNLQDMAPITVADGYAQMDVVQRPAKLGYSRFLGYDPVQLSIPVQFEAWISQEEGGAGSGKAVEKAIETLETMAGRRGFGARKPPPPIKIYTIDKDNKFIPVVPKGFGWEKSNPTAPTYTISNVAWAGGDLRDSNGNRRRSMATITVQEYTPLTITAATLTQRNRGSVDS